LKFAVDNKSMEKALSDIQGKGKYLGNGGLSSSKMGSYFYMVLEGNDLNLWNGDLTFGMNITITVAGIENGSFVGDAGLIIPYLKKFEDAVQFETGDFLKLSSGNRKASLPMIVNHPNMEAITRIRDMVKHISYRPEADRLWSFGKSKFEGSFMLNSTVFKDAISLCELVKSGVYTLNYSKEKVSFSSTANASNKYEEEIELSTFSGEGATLEYSGPLHNFFPPLQRLNFLVKDEFPLLIVGEDRMILKAPYTGGN
jgi:hypothetical protein